MAPLHTLITAALLAGALLWPRALAAEGLVPSVTEGAPADRDYLTAYDFEDGAEGWRVLKEGRLSKAPCRTAEAPQARGQSLRIDASLPPASGAGVTFADAAGRLHRFTHLLLSVYVPQSAPDKVQVIVYLKDAELSYYQHFRPAYLPRGSWTDLKLDLTARSLDWEPGGHFKPWDGYCRQDVLEFGVKFICEEAYEGPLFLDDIVLQRSPEVLPHRNAIYNLRINGAEIGRYEKFEVSLNLARAYANPFDPDEVKVAGILTRPDGTTTTVQGFFYQGYLRRMEDGAERLIPMGRSQWKIRFAPRQLGTYSYYVEVDDGERTRSESATFQCVESHSRGFIRVSRTDPDYLEFDDGTFYFPIGHNIAAVDDLRARAMGVAIPAAEGTYAYDRFLSKMAAAGENFGRIWMSPWGVGIEWTKAYDVHYRDLGRYNLHNAWRLDHVVEAARQQGVYLMLLFTAHGELGEHESDFYGHDPQRRQGSPYWTRYGGPLKSPVELYDSPEALKFYKRKARYIVARWGYATSIMAWEVLNEPDLGFFRKRDSEAIGRRAAEFVRQVILHIREHDPARHLVTSGMWNHRAPYAYPTLALEEMDIYAGHIFDADMAGRLTSDRQFLKDKFRKILLVTEAGISPFAQDPELTRRVIYNTLWTSYMLPCAGTACPWWWVLIDRKDLYGDFAGLAAFAEGEDRRGMDYRSAPASAEDKGGQRRLLARCLRNETRALCWVYDPASFSQRADWSEQKRAAAVVTVPGLQDGPYRVEVWDTVKGEVIATVEASTENGALTFEVPPFARDVACKVIRRRPGR